MTVVLDRPLEKSAFRTRMLSADLVEPIAKTRKGPNRPDQLYRLKRRKSPIYFARTFNPPRWGRRVDSKCGCACRGRGFGALEKFLKNWRARKDSNL
jgi:hypothetical protein